MRAEPSGTAAITSDVVRDYLNEDEARWFEQADTVEDFTGVAGRSLIWVDKVEFPAPLIVTDDQRVRCPRCGADLVCVETCKDRDERRYVAVPGVPPRAVAVEVGEHYRSRYTGAARVELLCDSCDDFTLTL